MNAEELAQCVRTAVWRARTGDYAGKHATAHDAAARITGIGQESYQISQDEQAFESYSLEKMLTGLREELLDVINYAVMLDILASRKLGEVRQLERRETPVSEALFVQDAVRRLAEALAEPVFPQITKATSEKEEGITVEAEVNGWPGTIRRIVADEDGASVEVQLDEDDGGDLTFGVHDRVMLVPMLELKDGEKDEVARERALVEFFGRFPGGSLSGAASYGADEGEKACGDVGTTNESACCAADDADAPAKEREPLFGLSFTVDAIGRDGDSCEVILNVQGPQMEVSDSVTGYIAQCWETSIGAEYVLIPKSAWESGYYN